jgi:uncharacterized protein (TIGR00251 family)
MKVSVQVKHNSKREGIQVEADGSLIVRVNAPPVDGKANKRVVELLAEHFGRPRSAISLVHGASGKKKIFEVSFLDIPFAV